MRYAVLLAFLCCCSAIQRYEPGTWQTFNGEWNESLKLQLVSIRNRGDELTVKLRLTNMYADPVEFGAGGVVFTYNGVKGRLVSGEPDRVIIGGETREQTLRFVYDKVLKPEGAVEIVVLPNRGETPLPPATLRVTVTTIAGQSTRY